jgi:hypothetical protein
MTLCPLSYFVGLCGYYVLGCWVVASQREGCRGLA